jgi:dTDP-4-amino-4,6-dideoxygalactose transaminase
MILLNDLKRQYRFNSGIFNRIIKKTLLSGRYILDKEVENFEKEFANFVGTKYAVGVANGLEALQIGFMCLNLREGDEVITTPMSAVATALAISLTGAKPVFVDIEKDTGLIDPEKIETKITKRTRAILPVHLYGNTCNMEKIISIAKKYKLYVIEDSCQAHGALFNNKHAGTFGIIGCFSFYPTKNLGGIGDGGIIVTDNERVYRTAKILRNYGQSDRYRHETIGLNSRLDEIQAALLRQKLKMLDRENKRRQSIASKYNNEINNPLITKLKAYKNSKPVWHLYPIRCNFRNLLQDYLRANGVETLIHYPIPIPFQKAYLGLRYKESELSVAVEWSRTVLSIPIHPYLKKEEIEKIIRKINSFR